MIITDKDTADYLLGALTETEKALLYKPGIESSVQADYYRACLHFALVNHASEISQRSAGAVSVRLARWRDSIIDEALPMMPHRSA